MSHLHKFYFYIYRNTLYGITNKFIETVVFDDKVAAPLKEFVEAQRTFTKQINRSVAEVADYSVIAAKNAFEKVKTAKAS